MTKSIIVSSESTNLYTTIRFLEEAKKLKLNPIHLNPFQFHLKIQNKNQKTANASHYLFRTTGIRFDDMDLLIAKDFESKGAKIINPLPSIINNRNKDMSLLNLKIGSFPTINSFVYRGKLNADLIKTISKISIDEKYILKMNRGNQGIGVQLINGLDSLLSILETYQALGDQKFLIQPYTTHQKEYRVLLTQKKVLGIIEKEKNLNDFRGNAKRAKTKVIKNLDNNTIEMCQQILKHLNFIYAGIDLIKTKDGIKIIEVNSIPGFESVEQLSGKNIAKELLLDFL